MSGKVGKVVLVSPLVAAPRLPRTNKYIFQTTLLRSVHQPWIAKWKVKSAFEKYVPTLLEQGIGQEYVDIYRRMLHNANPQVLTDSIYAIFHSDWSEYLGAIKDKPTLVLHSENDHKTFLDQAEFVISRLNNARSLLMNGEHEDFILKPNREVVGEILDFLRD